MQLTKTNFLQFQNCPKSLWLLKNKPKLYPQNVGSNSEDKLAAEGYEVQRLVQKFLQSTENSDKYFFEKIYKSEGELYACADIIRKNEDGTVNIYEVKSSGAVGQEHLTDATFQTIVVKKSGVKVRSVYIVHLNKEYIREDALNVEEMMTFSMVTKQVQNLIENVKAEIKLALDLLRQDEINEEGCSCLKLSKSHHCETFKYFNPSVPNPSIYNLPRIHKKKLNIFVNEGRYALDEIDENEVTGNQISVLQSAKTNSPVLNNKIIEKFYDQVTYPLYFLDYETFSSAIPVVDGVKPHAHIPFQFSIHVKMTKEGSNIEHYEYLADKAELPRNMIELMEKVIGSNGSIVSWHKSFENTRNKEMAILYPDKANFLNNVSDRTIDLEDIFKGGYVDIAFGGSTSIKKVLPVIVPDLNYANLEVANGTDAMEAFTRLLEMPNGLDKTKLQNEMLEYCKLDTLAMVEIFKKMEKYIS
jgi:CRISPR/Cas system-associated exonuclease Cas4 (RecB family)